VFFQTSAGKDPILRRVPCKDVVHVHRAMDPGICVIFFHIVQMLSCPFNIFPKAAESYFFFCFAFPLGLPSGKGLRQIPVPPSQLSFYPKGYFTKGGIGVPPLMSSQYRLSFLEKTPLSSQPGIQWLRHPYCSEQDCIATPTSAVCLLFISSFEAVSRVLFFSPPSCARSCDRSAPQ